jgi:hypothetical protein
MASLGCTVLERMTSDISRLRGMSSLSKSVQLLYPTMKLVKLRTPDVQARGGGALDLLIERAVGRGPEPARHGCGGAVLGDAVDGRAYQWSWIFLDSPASV